MGSGPDVEAEVQVQTCTDGNRRNNGKSRPERLHSPEVTAKTVFAVGLEYQWKTVTGTRAVAQELYTGVVCLVGSGRVGDLVLRCGNMCVRKKPPKFVMASPQQHGVAGIGVPQETCSRFAAPTGIKAGFFPLAGVSSHLRNQGGSAAPSDEAPQRTGDHGGIRNPGKYTKRYGQRDKESRL